MQLTETEAAQIETVFGEAWSALRTGSEDQAALRREGYRKTEISLAPIPRCSGRRRYPGMNQFRGAALYSAAARTLAAVVY